MNAGAEATRPAKVRAEQAARDRLMERLSGDFSHISREHINQTVDAAYREYERSPVRDFIAILVERSVRSELSEYRARHSA